MAVRSDAPYRHAFTYSVPPDLALAPGHGVLVPFGTRTLQGVVLSISPTTHFDGKVRSLVGVAGELPLVPPHLLELARWMAERYLAPLFSCVAPLLPAGVERRTRIRFVPVGDHQGATGEQRAILAALHENPAATPSDLQRATRLVRIPTTLDTMVRRGLLRRDYFLDAPSAGPRLVRSMRLTGRAGAVDVAGSLYRRLEQAGGVLPLATFRRLPEWGNAAARHLVETGLALETEERVLRDPLAGKDFPLSEAPILTSAQAAAVEQILAADSSNRPCLLHGVTGSGKTEVYLAATAATLAAGRRALILVPEISLTPQTVERFAGRFPGRVAVLHSALSDGQRYDQWCGIRERRFDVVVGSRSAIFAPLEELGLIVIDEEHEWTYKQFEQQPRYQTRDVAAHLAALTGASVVLGSATPDVVSYARAVRGRYQLLELPDRVRPHIGGATEADAALPKVEIVDLSRELREGNRSIFSRSLSLALQEVLTRGEQALLFLNRRGSANFLLCRDCGHVPRCSRCGISFTYHAEGERLLCHQCGRSRRAPSVCPRCRSTRVRRLGAGTQRVVEEVERHFPDARVVRWDRDSVHSAEDHGDIFRRLQRGEADVLVGTQMVAKGLDLPLVTLVGVVNADLSLNVPEYYSAERAFQLLTQVAGRAGRRDRPGRVILQTYAPNHYAVRAAADHDYGSFFNREIGVRRRGEYPPFARLTRLVHASSGSERAEAEARRMAAELRRAIVEGRSASAEVIGPSPCHAARLRGRWRWQILIRCPRPSDLLNLVSFPEGWSIDVDPQTFA
ncbi:MAG TPA: primosomal protein N' [Dehalococcoidia bacterium]|nr:primosomal protein N' [Dehalococcoidia bacterium]